MWYVFHKKWFTTHIEREHQSFQPNVLDLKYVPTKNIGYSLDPGIYEVVDLNNTLKYILPDNVKVNVTIDDIKLKSNLKTSQTLIFTEKSTFILF